MKQTNNLHRSTSCQLPAGSNGESKNGNRATVISVERLSPDIVALRVRRAVANSARFKAGQWMRLTFPGGESRCYSMANPHDNHGLIDFHVRVRRHGAFAKWLEAYADRPAQNDSLLVSMACGTGLWDHVADDAPVLLFATGTGIAPIKAILEEALAKELRNPIHLYWGNRHRHDFYLADFLLDYASRNAHFRYTPVLSGEDSTWTGRIGYVHDVAGGDDLRLQGAYGYACGGVPMVQSTRALFESQEENAAGRFFSDAFETSDDVPAATTDVAGELSLHVVLADNTRCQVKAGPGVSLMSVLRQEMIVMAVCGGKGVCGTCRVAISPSWFGKISPPKLSESRLLAALEEETGRDRLSCQIPLTSDLDGLELQILDRAL